jgi:hypothetical protein
VNAPLSTVTALSAAFDVLYANKAGKTPGGKTPVGSRFAAPWASEPSTLLMFTIRPAGERRSSGSTALVTRTTPKTFVS